MKKGLWLAALLGAASFTANATMMTVFVELGAPTVVGGFPNASTTYINAAGVVSTTPSEITTNTINCPNGGCNPSSIGAYLSQGQSINVAYVQTATYDTNFDPVVVDWNNVTIQAISAINFSILSRDDDARDGGENTTANAQEAWEAYYFASDFSGSPLVIAGANVVLDSRGPSTFGGVADGVNVVNSVPQPGNGLYNYLVGNNIGSLGIRVLAMPVPGQTSSDFILRAMSGTITVGVNIDVPDTDIPEPATSALAGGALLLLGVLGSRFRR